MSNTESLIKTINGQNTLSMNGNHIIRGGMIMEMSLKIGDRAPEFSLAATTKEKIALSDYLGEKNIVIAFYGMDFTPG